jgi:predicted porin
VYGVVDGGYTTQKDASNNSDPKFASGITSNPRLGFKGTEDLGGGLKAIFVVETGLSTGKETATSIGDRGAFVGLEGSFGTVTMGASQLSPSFYAGAITSAVGADNYGLKKYAMIDSRNDNSVNYTSPTLLGGLTLRGAMVQKANNGGSKAATDFSAIYVNGPLTLSASAADNGFDKGNHVGGAYNLGVVKVFLSHTETAGTAAVTGTGFTQGSNTESTVLAVKGTAEVKSEKYTNVGISAPVGSALTLAAEYRQAKITDINTLMLSAQYSLSKRSTLTAYASKADKANSIVGFGVRHTF